MGIEMLGSFRAGKPVGLLLAPTMKTLESGLPWIALGDEVIPKVCHEGQCMWCSARYSTKEELQRHHDDRRYHLSERLAATEKLADRFYEAVREFGPSVFAGVIANLKTS